MLTGIKKEICFLLTILLFISHCVSNAQDQRFADSLRKIYLHTDEQDTFRLELLRNLAFNEVSDYKIALNYADELIALAEKTKINAKEAGNVSREGTSYGAVADVYAVLKNHQNAMTLRSSLLIPGTGTLAIKLLASSCNSVPNKVLGAAQGMVAQCYVS
jgi:hypothetical protein